MSECHRDFVQCVTFITSRPARRLSTVGPETAFYADVSADLRQIPLDVRSGEWRNCGDTYAEISHASGSQDRRPATRRCAPSPSRAHPRPGVPHRPVLRPPRPGPGEIRDGAAPPGRGTDGHRRGGGVQRQSPGLLRNRRGVRGRRPAGAAAEAAGAEARAQMHRGDPRLRRALGRAGRGSRRCGGDRSALPHHDSPPLARARVGPAENKTSGGGTR